MPAALLAALPLLTEVLKLVNNLIEGKSPEQREAEAMIWFDILWAPFKPLFPAETQAAVEALMKQVKDRQHA